MANKEIYLSLLYFLLQGILIPNFDDLHYIFLVEKCGMRKFMYDLLNSLTYVGVILITILFNKYLSKVNVRMLIYVQLLIFFVINLLQLCNSLRWNLKVLDFVGISHSKRVFFDGGNLSDIMLNSVCFLFGVYATANLATLPV